MADQSAMSPLTSTEITPATTDSTLSEATSAAQNFLRGLLPATTQARLRVYSALLRSLVSEGVMQ